MPKAAAVETEAERTPEQQILDVVNEGLDVAPPEDDDSDAPPGLVVEGESNDPPLVVDEKPADDEPAAEAKPDEEPAAEVEEEAKPEAEAKPETEKAARPSDEFGELPKDAPEKTKERFETMRTKFDEVHGELEQFKEKYTTLESEHEELIETIKSTGTNADQFGMLLNYTTLVNSRDPTDWHKAYEIIQGELQTLSKALGKEAPGVDPLEAYPDLKAELEAGDLSRERALEIASMRATHQAAQTNREHLQQENATQQARTQALRDLNNLGIELAKDPVFHVKQPVLQQIAQIVVTNEPDPKKWVSHIKEAYGRIQIPESSAPAAPTAPNAPSPVRPVGSGPSGNNLDKQPGSVLEAVNMALDQM